MKNPEEIYVQESEQIFLYYYANAKNYLVLGSSDKSEYMIGYFTKFGDGAADIISNYFTIQTSSKGNRKILWECQHQVIAKKSSPTPVERTSKQKKR